VNQDYDVSQVFERGLDGFSDQAFRQASGHWRFCVGVKVAGRTTPRARAAPHCIGRLQSGRTVYIRGEAGIGKTRLLEALLSSAREQSFACHTGLVLDFGTGVGRDAIHQLREHVGQIGLRLDPTELASLDERGHCLRRK
jgi:hypothetical protein